MSTYIRYLHDDENIMHWFSSHLVTEIPTWMKGCSLQRCNGVLGNCSQLGSILSLQHLECIEALIKGNDHVVNLPSIPCQLMHLPCIMIAPFTVPLPICLVIQKLNGRQGVSNFQLKSMYILSPKNWSLPCTARWKCVASALFEVSRVASSIE